MQWSKILSEGTSIFCIYDKSFWFQAPSNNISQYSTNPCTGIASCAGCVQQSLQSQAYCQQQPQSAEVAQQAATATAMEMTAILHSQPPLQLVSCHGPIMSQSTPLNQRYGGPFFTCDVTSFRLRWFEPRLINQGQVFKFCWSLTLSCDMFFITLQL